MVPDFLTPRRAVAAVLVVSLVGAVGLTGILTDEGTDREAKIGANASEQVAALDGIEATVTTVVTKGKQTNRTTWQLQRRPTTDNVRLQARSAVSGPDVIVANGTYRWSYNSGNDTVWRTDASGMDPTQTNRGERIERLFRHAKSNDERTETQSSLQTPGVSPLPAVPEPPRTTPTATADRNTSGTYTVSYDGTSTVDGREVHVLHVQSQNDTGQQQYSSFSQTLWIDSEWFVPLQYRTTWRENGQQTNVTVRYSNVSFNPGFDANTFQFEMPENAALVSPTLGLNATEQLQEIDGISATLTSRITGFGFNDSSVANGGGYRMTQRIAMQPGTGKRRATVVNTSTPNSSFGADLVVSNGTVTWTYNRAENNVTVLDSPLTASIEQEGERIERLFTRLNLTRPSPDTAMRSLPDLGVAPISSTVGASGFASSEPTATSDSDERYGVEFDGVDQVDGRPAYVLSIDPLGSDDASSILKNYSQTLWIDAETFLPLNQRTTFVSDGDLIESETTYSNITINPGLNASDFEFEPPANATVIDQDLSIGDTYATRSAVTANTSLPVPDPSLPADFTFDSGRTSNTEYAESVILTYTNATSQLTVDVYEFNETNGSFNTTGEPIQIGDSNATFSQTGMYRSVSWSCDGLEYGVSGKAISKATLVDVAKSIDC